MQVCVCASTRVSPKENSKYKVLEFKTNIKNPTIRYPDSPHLVLSTTGLPEVCDGGQLSLDRLPIEPAVVEAQHSILSVFLITKLW